MFSVGFMHLNQESILNSKPLKTIQTLQNKNVKIVLSTCVDSPSVDGNYDSLKVIFLYLFVK